MSRHRFRVTSKRHIANGIDRIHLEGRGCHLGLDVVSRFAEAIDVEKTLFLERDAKEDDAARALMSMRYSVITSKTSNASASKLPHHLFASAGGLLLSSASETDCFLASVKEGTTFTLSLFEEE